tara:strand:+ start:1244 stop:1366 length:123 start_codon:yes stop_codon:yes gene_type:complete
MDGKKDKEKVTIKWFPGHDLLITAFIVICVIALGILKACK